MKELNKTVNDGISLLINNAGTHYKSGEYTNSDLPYSIEIETAESLMFTYKTNVIGPFLLTKVFYTFFNSHKVALNTTSQQDEQISRIQCYK